MFSCLTTRLKTALNACVKSLKKLHSKYEKKQNNVINNDDKATLNEVSSYQPICGHIGHHSESLESVPYEFCGQDQHPRSSCPARNTQCDFCKIPGHFRSVCRKLHKLSQANPTISLAAFSPSLAATVVPVKICGVTYNALLDTGSTYSFIDVKVANRLSNLLNALRY